MRNGFTLVELLVVITILAVLAGAAIPFVQAYVEESRISKCKTDLEEISRALVVFETREGEFPDTVSPLTDGYSDLKILAGRYLQKSPIDPWGNPYVVDVNAGTVFSKGPDRAARNDQDGNSADNIGDDADNISVSYKPPLALVSVKWVDRNQNGVFDADNVPDQLILNFSRKIDATAWAIRAAALNKWLRISTNGSLTNTVSLESGGYVQAAYGVSTLYPSSPDVLTSSRDIILSLKSPIYLSGTTNVVMGKAFLIVDDPRGNNTGLYNGDEIKDVSSPPSLCLSSQRVMIIPQ